MRKNNNAHLEFVQHFRQAAPYIQAHRGKTLVVNFGGEAVENDFEQLVHDIALIHALGVRLVLIHGARPQIEQRLEQRGAELRYVNGLRVTDSAALAAVTDAVGSLRVEIEARLTMSLVNTPTAGARIGVASGNFVIARPIGIRDGVDYDHTGSVRRIDARGISAQLDAGRIVLLSPLGYSPTGEIFNLSAEEVATAAAVALHADKLVLLVEKPVLRDGRRRPIRQLSVEAAAELLKGRRKLDEQWVRHIESALASVRRGVRRTHIVDQSTPGGLLLELFTRDGTGTLISGDTYEGLRNATIEDVGGILELITPLERDGTLVARSREMLEIDIDRFMVVERDGMVVGCAALYPYESDVAELACLAVHPDYRGEGRGDTLLEAIEKRALAVGCRRVFILTTQTSHWFRERGFNNVTLDSLPVRKQQLYNYQRKSKALVKELQ